MTKELTEYQKNLLLRLELETIHYRQTGCGWQFLKAAWDAVFYEIAPYGLMGM